MTARFRNAAEAADYLGLSEHRVRNDAKAGLLPHHKVGRLIRFTTEDLDTYVERTAVTEQAGGMRRTDAAKRRRRAAS